MYITGEEDAAKSDAAGAVGWHIAGEVADILVDKAIPGPTPDITDVAERLSIKKANNALKQRTAAKLTVVENALDEKQ